jgi:mRNA interferase MazF
MFQDYFLALLEWWKINILLKTKPYNHLFKEGEIWWCSIGMNVGVEIFGKGPDFSRPVVIFKKFNADSFLGIPLTTQPKEGRWYAQINFGGKERKAILTQARTFDAKRLIRKLSTLNPDGLYNLQIEFIQFYGPENLRPTPEELESGAVGNPNNLPH